MDPTDEEKRRALSDRLRFAKRGPDPEDAYRVEEFAHRSQDPRAAPWEALARGGHRVDSALGIPQMWPDPTKNSVGADPNWKPGQPPGTIDANGDPVPHVGLFEGWAKAIPGMIGTALAGRTQGGPNSAVLPSGAKSLEGMKDSLVLRDALESKGAREILPYREVGRGGYDSNSDMADIFWNSKRPHEALDSEARVADVVANNTARRLDTHPSTTDPILLRQENDDFTTVRQAQPIGTPEIPEPSQSPERASLEDYFRRLIERKP